MVKLADQKNNIEKAEIWTSEEKDENVRQEDRKGWIGHLMSGPILNLLWLSKQIEDKQVKSDVEKFLKETAC